MLVSINRIFQIPQLFRPTVTNVLSNTVGQVNLERPANGLTAVAYWVRFARWCKLHPVQGPAKGQPNKDRGWLHDLVIRSEGLECIPITYLEFGVYRGDSVRWWLGRIVDPKSRFVGFDTFTGLPEWWRATEPAGHFNADGRVPDIKDSRCSFQVGLFQETLPQFVRENDLSGRLVVHLDADMFTSTLYVLTNLAKVLKPGDILFFDEFSCPLDEFRAFEEFTRAFRVKYEVLGAVQGYTRVAIKIS
jgi:O-methyltransferase